MVVRLVNLIFKNLENIKNNLIKFDPLFFKKITGFDIDQKKMIKILNDLGFEIKKEKKDYHFKGSIMETRY